MLWCTRRLPRAQARPRHCLDGEVAPLNIAQHISPQPFDPARGAGLESPQILGLGKGALRTRLGLSAWATRQKRAFDRSRLRRDSGSRPPPAEHPSDEAVDQPLLGARGLGGGRAALSDIHHSSKR